MADAARMLNSDRITTQRARPAVVAQLLAMHGVALALATGLPAAAAAVDGEYRLMAVLALASLPPMIAFVLSRRAGACAEPRKIEALVAVAAAFLLASLLATPAFIVLGADPVSAWFEAVSAITTTGLSVVGSTEAWPASAHFLRAWLQWAGGFAFAALALAIVLGPGVVSLRLGLVERPGENILGSTRFRARSVLVAYVVLSVAAVSLCAAIAANPLDGVVVALAAISTGGFAPEDDSLAGVGAMLQAAVVVVVLAGAVSMTLYAQAWRSGFRKVAGDKELALLLLLCVAGSLGVIVIEMMRDGGIAAWDSVFTVISAQSTAGFSTIAIASHAPATLILLIGLMAIGGSIGSTAGGIKIFRASFAAAAAQKSITRTALSPNALSALRVHGEQTEPHDGTDVFALIVIYFVAVFALWLATVATGFDPLFALFDTVSAFSTVGLSSGVVGADLPGWLKLGFIAAMLLGRLEFLAFLALIRPRTWLS